MKKNNIYKLLSFLVLSTIIICFNQVTHASWVYLSADDLIEKSDHILIGEVVRKTGETKEVISEIMWQVKVEYYLKGEMREQIITVTTPSNNVSTHYDLDEWGKRVLIFINKRGDYYSPLSPQGVIPITLDDNITNSQNVPSGQELLSNIKIIDPKLDGDYKVKLEEFIKSKDVFLPNEIQSQKTDNSLLYLYFVLGISILIVLFKVRKTRSK